ncbi:MAG TPA: sensor domain-containing diguanylate cyclase [Methylophaga aminisulfidivorans]|uniref:diguanylate cyclase n=2 Tax=root TaxID=1 RepID=A0A7C1W2T5_9GAMM|nr:sensor domain-containing diguanylate cyclase [Methylophaga aminisulfidivorans]
MNTRKRQYALVISLIVLVGSITTSLIGYFVAKSSIEHRLQDEMLPLTSDNIYSEIQRDLLQPLLISSVMANDSFVLDWVNSGEIDSIKMQRYLKQIQDKYETITAFFVSDKTKRYYHSSGVLKNVSSDEEADSWYFDTKKSDRDYLINIDNDTAEPSRLSIFVNYKVLDKKGQFIGVIGIGLSLEIVEELIETYQQKFGREVYLIDATGKVMLKSSSYNDNALIQNDVLSDKLMKDILSVATGSFSYSFDGANTIYLNSRYVPEFSWYLMVEQINDPAADGIESALIFNLLISMAISGMTLLILHFASRGYQGKLESMATKDKLTGVYNRQIFDSLFNQALSTTKRRQQSLTISLIDIDFFKRINDNYGHAHGDEILKSVIELMKANLRQADIICRWGGEEFIIMMSDCDENSAKRTLNMIRELIAEKQFHLGNDKVKITISGGVAEHTHDETMRQVINRADKNLYMAKNQGRNRVV